MIYYCIPVHNEEKTAGVVLWKIRQVMAEFPRDYQILLADDASSDGTMGVLDPYRRVLPLILMRNNRRRGYAASLEMLLREAARRSRYPRRDIVVIMQADFSEDAEYAPALVRRMESGADIAVGGPIDGGARPGIISRTASRMAQRWLRRREWPEAVTDPLNGFTAIRLSCIRKAFEERPEGRLLRWEGRVANAALLAAVAPHARRIDAIEMTLHPERRTRPTRSRSIPVLRDVYRFVHDRAAPGLVPPDSLVPDEVHGDLSALRQEQPVPEAGPGRPRQRAEREQRVPRARKDGGAPRPRRERPPRAAARPVEPGEPVEPARPVEPTGPESPAGPDAAAESGGTEPGRRRRRGGRGGERRRRPREPRPAAAPAANGQGEGDEPVADAPPATEPAPGEGQAGPKKRRRRGRRGRSGRRPPNGAGGPEEAVPVQPSEPDRGPAESNGA